MKSKREQKPPSTGLIQRRYTPDDLRALFSFCQQDFDRFIDLVIWLDSLPDREADEQTLSARQIHAMKQGKAI